MEGGPPIFRQDCSCPALLEDGRSGFPYGAVTRYGPPFQTLPVPKPTATGLVRFRSPLLAESRLMSVPPATEMFQFAGFASRAYEFSAGYPARVAPWGWVAPFGDPGINDRSHLPRAFRSVPRPSSPLSAKASTRCPSFALDPKRGPAPASPPVTTPAFRKTAAHRGKRQAGSLRSFETDRSARLRRIAPLLATPTQPSHEDTSPDRPRHRPRPHRPRPAPEAVRLGHIRKSALPFNQPRPRCRRRPTGRPTPSRGHGPPGTASSRPGTKLHLLRTSSSERRDQRSKGRDQITTGEPAPPAIEAPGGGCLVEVAWWR